MNGELTDTMPEAKGTAGSSSQASSLIWTSRAGRPACTAAAVRPQVKPFRAYTVAKTVAEDDCIPKCANEEGN